MAQDRPVEASIDFVSTYSDLAGRVIASLPSSDMGARVPACPGWSTYDLVVHLGNVHGWAATVVETGRRAPPQDDHPPTRGAPEVARWYAGKAEDLLAVLRDVGTDAACWTFSDLHRGATFWTRRQAHETLVHLVDLDQAAGRTSDVEPGLAADAVAEVLEVFLPRMHARGRPAELLEPIILRTTDTGDAWMLTPRAEGPPEVAPGARAEDPAEDLVEAPAAQLMQVLWKRLPHDDVRVRDRVAAFLRSPLTS